MFVYTYKDNDTNTEYIIGMNDSELEIFKDYQYHEEFSIPDYDSTKIYNLQTKTVVPDSSAIVERFKTYAFKDIKTKIHNTCLVNTAYTKIMYIYYLYQSILADGEFIGKIDELIPAIENNEIEMTQKINNFLANYNTSLKMKIKIILPLERFDRTFFDVDSTIFDLFGVIKTLNELYTQEPYTFLKNNVY